MFIFNKSTVVYIVKRRLLYFIIEMSVVPNFDINWNALEQIEMDDELENTFLQLIGPGRIVSASELVSSVYG
jgi:hypothetical protein